jgi:hypothetical protein
MSNHIHLIISTNGITKLSDVIRDFKKISSFSILKAIQDNPQESRKNGCYGFSKRQVSLIIKIKSFNFGGRIIIRLNVQQKKYCSEG